VSNDFLNQADELDALRQRGSAQCRSNRDVAQLIADVCRALDSSWPQPPASPELAAFLAGQESKTAVPETMSDWLHLDEAPDFGPAAPVTIGTNEARRDERCLLVRMAPDQVAPPTRETGKLRRSGGRARRLLIGAVAVAALVAGIAGLGESKTTRVLPVVTPARTPSATDLPTPLEPRNDLESERPTQRPNHHRIGGRSQSTSASRGPSVVTPPAVEPRTAQPLAGPTDRAGQGRQQHRPDSVDHPQGRLDDSGDSRAEDEDQTVREGNHEQASPEGDSAGVGQAAESDADRDVADGGAEEGPTEEPDGDAQADSAVQPDDARVETTCRGDDCPAGSADPGAH